MRKVRFEDIWGWGPCWSKEEIPKAVEGKSKAKWSALDVLALDHVPAEDRLWVVLREDFLTRAQLRLFGADCAVRALIREREQGREPDPRSWRAVEVARDFALGGTTKTELSAAANAANTAWEDAANAAWAAATRDAANAAWSAAWYAARAAARAAHAAARVTRAAHAARAAATRDAERDEQIKRLRELIQSGVGACK